MVLRAQGLDELAASLREGGTVVGSIDDLGGARMVDIYDPDGNQIVLMEPV